MTDPDFAATMDLLAALASPFTAVPIEDVKAALRTCEMAETLGPLLDPTAYRDGVDRLDQNRRFLRAVLAFRSVLDSLRPAEVLE